MRIPIMDIKKIFITALVLMLLTAVVALGIEYFILKNQISAQQTFVKSSDKYLKILAFGRLFVERVLINQSQVDFNARLQIENAVRDTDDRALINQWQTFVNSQSEAEAQAATAKLLDMILIKGANP